MSHSWVRCSGLRHQTPSANAPEASGNKRGGYRFLCGNHAAWETEVARLLRQPLKKGEDISAPEKEMVPHAAVYHHLRPHGQTSAARSQPEGRHCAIQGTPQGGQTLQGSRTTIPAVCSPASPQHHQLDLSRPRQQTARMIRPVMG